MTKDEELAERRRRYIRFVPPEKERKVPEGCIDVWQVTSYQQKAFKYHGVFDDVDEALAFAETLLTMPLKDKRSQKNPPLYNIRVEHKAAVQLPTGQFHLVHFNPIRWRGRPMVDAPFEIALPSQTTLSHHEQNT